MRVGKNPILETRAQKVQALLAQTQAQTQTLGCPYLQLAQTLAWACL